LYRSASGLLTVAAKYNWTQCRCTRQTANYKWPRCLSSNCRECQDISLWRRPSGDTSSR